MTDGTKVEYWDTCIFLAYIKGEEHRPGELDYIKAQASRFDAGKLSIVTSSITIAEIREATLTVAQIDQLRQIYRRSNFLFIDVTPQVSEVASKIRSFYTTNPILAGDGKALMLHTADAIHVASAIAAQKGAKEPVKLLTLDSDNKSKSSSVGLEKISGNVAGDFPLIIGRPDVKGYQLKLAAVPEPPTLPLPELPPIEKASQALGG